MEALIVFPVMMLVFIGCMYFTRRSLSLQHQLATTQQRLWHHALRDCDSNMTADTEMQDHASALSPLLRTWIPPYHDLVHGLQKGQVLAADSVSLSRPNALGGGRKTLDLQLSLSCDTPTHNTQGNLASVVHNTFCRTGACN